MALNDEADRLSTAEDYLLTYPPDSQEFEAALEHVRWVHGNKPEFKKRCEEILANVVRHRHEEVRAMKKLGN